MIEDPDAMAGRQIRLPAIAWSAEAGPADTWPADTLSAEVGLPLAATPDLAEIARLILAATVPGFAAGASVFALDHLLKGSESAGRAAGGQVVARRLGTKHAGRRVPDSAFPAGEVIAFAADSPYARCVDSGHPVAFGEPDGQTLERVRPDGREVLSGYGSFLAVPMTARDTVTGLVVLARTPDAPAFSDRDAAVAARLGTQAGTGIANALTLVRQRSVADALQRGLLVNKRRYPRGSRWPGGACRPPAMSSAATGTTSSRCPAAGQAWSSAT